MTTYIISLLSASLAITLLTVIAPESGIGKHVRLITALFLICVIIAPIGGLLGGLRDLANGSFTLPELTPPQSEDAEEELQKVLDHASKDYFLQSLEQMIVSKLGVKQGDIRCTAIWNDTDEGTVPTRITVLLSGSAIWKDPEMIEFFVSDLLSCDCVTAIE
ncbi:MAG: stage III sporulation protein AF [Clostridia bacterium]|nr:stage III sporulation protein AF [Clostridia bacterium]